MTPAVGNNTIEVKQRMECILYWNVMLFHIKLKKKSHLKILDICVIDKTLLSSVN